MLNLSQFLIYSIWFGFISNGWWLATACGFGETLPLGIFVVVASIGWVVNFGFLLVKHFDDKG